MVSLTKNRNRYLDWSYGRENTGHEETSGGDDFDWHGEMTWPWDYKNRTSSNGTNEITVDIPSIGCTPTPGLTNIAPPAASQGVL